MKVTVNINSTVILLVSAIIINLSSCTQKTYIDRFALVIRNNIENLGIDSLNALSVGNGEFSFTTDITGLQTFPGYYAKGTSLTTKANWILHAGESPQIISLDIVGLQILKADGTEISISDIKDPVQELDLWTGELESRFNIEGVPVHIKIFCHPDYDMISVKITSDLIAKKRLKVKINLSQSESSLTGSGLNPIRIDTAKVVTETNNITIFRRTIDKMDYDIIVWRNSAELKEFNQKLYYLEPDYRNSVYSFSCQFLNNPENGRIQNFGETEFASKRSWEEFWLSGGIIDFSECTDPQAKELERLVLFSQYLTKIQCNRSLKGNNNLPVALPVSGDLVRAVAGMCVSDKFPHDGKWKVKWENLDEYVK